MTHEEKRKFMLQILCIPHIVYWALIICLTIW